MQNKYKTVQGDTWDSIAFKFYQNEEYADVLMRANPDKIEWFVFESGIEIVVPSIAEIETDKIKQFYPEWRIAKTSEESSYG